MPPSFLHATSSSSTAFDSCHTKIYRNQMKKNAPRRPLKQKAPKEKDSGEECPICYLPYATEPNEQIVETNTCGHIGHRFHRSCLLNWLQGANNTCPTYRQDFYPSSASAASPTIPFHNPINTPFELERAMRWGLEQSLAELNTEQLPELPADAMGGIRLFATHQSSFESGSFPLSPLGSNQKLFHIPIKNNINGPTGPGISTLQ